MDAYGAPAEPSVAELISSVKADAKTLVQDQIALAKIEFREAGKKAGPAVAMFVVAAVLGVLASIMLSVAAGYGLVAAGLAPGWAFLVVTVVYLLVAGLLAGLGARRLKGVKPPRRAIAAAQESKQALTRSVA